MENAGLLSDITHPFLNPAKDIVTRIKDCNFRLAGSDAPVLCVENAASASGCRAAQFAAVFRGKPLQDLSASRTG
ncbi:Iggfc-Binding Protein [Manis pentadactyla]|nr:Iggfc-Binding Protein [Manis pentadactyla]